MNNPVFCALDVPILEAAIELAGPLAPCVGGFKVGLELFSAEGPRAIERIKAFGRPVFLDAKLHDIPNTVEGALRVLERPAPDFVTLHAGGGKAMMKAAAAVAATWPTQLTLLAVTVLTSLNAEDLEDTGIAVRNATDQVLRLTDLALGCGIPGIVCSPREISPIRERFGSEAVLMVPGIRPASAALGDQKRVWTPQDAIRDGANHLVIGRPITRASDPVGAATDIVRTLGSL